MLSVAPAPRPVAQAAAWMLGALVSFLAMAVAGRELAKAGLSTFQVLFFRSVIGLVVIAALVWHTGPALLRTRRIGEHAWRNLAHFGGQFGWFFALAAMPLAEVFAIEFTIPIWTALLGALFLGERLTPARWLALALGLAGVLLVLRPGAALLQPAALAALGGAIAWPWLAVVGVTALTAHYCLTRALRLADMGLVLPIDFLRLPLVALIGYAFYGEAVGALALAGALLIVAGNVINLRAAR